MPTHIEYTRDDGLTVLVEAESVTGGVVKASRSSGVDVMQAGKNFAKVLAGCDSLQSTLKRWTQNNRIAMSNV